MASAVDKKNSGGTVVDRAKGGSMLLPLTGRNGGGLLLLTGIKGIGNSLAVVD